MKTIISQQGTDDLQLRALDHVLLMIAILFLSILFLDVSIHKVFMKLSIKEKLATAWAIPRTTLYGRSLSRWPSDLSA